MTTVVGGVRAAVTGVRAALEAARWLRGDRWQGLLEARGGGAGTLPPRLAVKVALRALRLLAHLPGGHWRNTCLFRSVAECLVLRSYGVDARLRIGVGREGAAPTDIVAHAWVLCPGQTDLEVDARAGTLRILDGHA